MNELLGSKNSPFQAGSSQVPGGTSCRHQPSDVSCEECSARRGPLELRATGQGLMGNTPLELGLESQRVEFGQRSPRNVNQQRGRVRGVAPRWGGMDKHRTPPLVNPSPALHWSLTQGGRASGGLVGAAGVRQVPVLLSAVRYSSCAFFSTGQDSGKLQLLRQFFVQLQAPKL